MKIGDIVLNHHAGIKNPYRFSVYIGRAGKHKRCLCFDGHISLYDNAVDLEVVDYIPIREKLLRR